MNEKNTYTFEIWKRYFIPNKNDLPRWQRKEYNIDYTSMFSEFSREVISRSEFPLGKYLKIEVVNDKIVFSLNKELLVHDLIREIKFPEEEIFSLFLKYNEIYDPFQNESFFEKRDDYDPRITVNAIINYPQEGLPDESWFDTHDTYKITAPTSYPDSTLAQRNLSYSVEQLLTFDLTSNNFITITKKNQSEPFENMFSINLKNSNDQTKNRIRILRTEYHDLFYFEILLNNVKESQIINIKIPEILTYKEKNKNPSFYNFTVKDFFENNKTKEIVLDKFVIQN